jgi:hypothetical protein
MSDLLRRLKKKSDKLKASRKGRLYMKDEEFTDYEAEKESLRKVVTKEKREKERKKKESMWDELAEKE